jgi:hypothetical protein|uniref:Uncharacterized protein n=1 Tax=viral metagenome TaxID=1070528 RepID=A0A6C0INV4_9ZZZZ
MYQLLVPIGFVGVVFYLHNQYEKYILNNNCLHNGTFDDFYIVNIKNDCII